MPSGSYLQVATTYTRIPTDLWRCTCQAVGKSAQLAERELDWYGPGARKAEWRNTTLANVTARLIDEIVLHKAKRNHASAVHPSIHTR
eukprot:7633933-Pyramimonas_sp.AAC.1